MAERAGRTTPKNASLAALGLLLLLALIWASSFTLIRATVDVIPPFTLVAMRLAFAGAGLLALIALTGQSLPRDRDSLVVFLLLGLTGNAIPFVLISIGEQEISSALASILIGFMPLATALIAHGAIPDERLTPLRLAGVVLGVTGVVVLLGADALNDLGHHVLAELAIVGAALSYAVNTVLARRARRIAPDLLATGAVLAAFLMILPFALVLDSPWTLEISVKKYMQTIALGIICTAGGYLIFFRLTAMAGATFTSMVNLLIPVIGLGFGLLLLDESLSWSMALALPLILAGLLLNRLAAGRGR
jgi:drug/metabolite transporter (DMT)-like permease